MTSAADLPDDIDALKALLIAAEAQISAQNATLTERDGIIERKQDRIIRLEKLLADFKRALFGAKSEKGHPDQYHLALEDIETAMAVVHAEDEAIDPPKTSGVAKSAKGRGVLPKHLPRIDEIIAPENTTCDCGHERHAIGEDVSERLDIVPAQFRVIVTRRPRYACRSCESGIIQAPAPAHLIPGGMPTEATLAHVIVSKYADHLPLYRQAQIYSRQSIDLDRSTLAAWVGRAAFELRPVYEALLANLKQSTKLFMDETTAPVLDPGKRKTKTGYFWALARDDRPWGGEDPPGVAFTYAPGRSGQYADQILKSFSGILQVDGYAGYNRLLKRPGMDVTLAYCWAHARRKLHEVSQTGTTPIADEGLKQIGKLYQVEKDIRGLLPDARRAARQDRSKPIIDAFEVWLTTNRARVSAKSPIGEAPKYIAKYWDGLILFLDDGRIELDSNAVERTIRPIARGWSLCTPFVSACKH